MDQRVLSVLEYDKVLRMLTACANCCVGRELAAALIPQSRLAAVERELSLTAEAEAYLYRTGTSPVQEFNDAREPLRQARAISAFTCKELLDVLSCLRALRTAANRLAEPETEGVILGRMAENLPVLKPQESEISRCILSEEEVADQASHELASLRQKLRRTHAKARERLNDMVRSHQKYLQEPIVTLRGGRYVLPVKQEYRQHVPGLVHDQSGSGATLFIEPAAVVELGNEARRLAALEEEEIQRILAGLTAMIAPHAEELLEGLALLGEIDLIFAKAALAKKMRAVRPALNETGFVHIVAGRHPLIPEDKVVPVDVWVGDEFQTLVITGPNTGGKTVTLKLVGLFALMAQAGMFLPAREGTRLCVFDQVFADIGDEQSIEQSLSTFSSHMGNIVAILARADERSLVLLDELGAGTDPVEGAALAMSILSELHARGTRTLATTHYSEIKAFALATLGMENASMEFDVDKLSPTYRLFVGIPGRSNAFEIAGRLGLSAHVIDAARSYLQADDIRFEDIIVSAQAQHQHAVREKEQAETLRRELEDKLRALEKELDRARAERDKQREKAKEEARQLVRDTRAQMDALVKTLREHGGQSERAIQEARDALRAQEEALNPPAAPKAARLAAQAPQGLKAGDAVRILSLDAKAVVLTPPDGKGEAVVQAGAMKLTVKLEDLEPAQPEQRTEGAHRGLNAEAVPLSLDIRGMLVDDAVIEVDRYLDAAAMTGRGEVMIIHGKGTGSLRAGVQAYLKNNPRVKSFRLGAYGEGDAGVTVVTLKGE